MALLQKKEETRQKMKRKTSQSLDHFRTTRRDKGREEIDQGKITGKRKRGEPVTNPPMEKPEQKR